MKENIRPSKRGTALTKISVLTLLLFTTINETYASPLNDLAKNFKN